MPQKMPNDLKNFHELKYSLGEEYPRSSKILTLAMVPPRPALDILDVGCGTGLNSAVLSQAGHRVVGIDFAEAAILKYRARGFVGHVMDLRERLDFPDETFDLVFASEVIEHLDTISSCLREFRRVLRPHGTLLLSTPNSAFWVYRIMGCLGYTVSELQHPGHITFFSRRSLEQLVKEAGFTLRSVTGRNMYLLVGNRLARPIAPLLRSLGFQREHRLKTHSDFWHLSRHSSSGLSFWADTLIVKASKRT